jgi:hypothetical protein
MKVKHYVAASLVIFFVAVAAAAPLAPSINTAGKKSVIPYSPPAPLANAFYSLGDFQNPVPLARTIASADFNGDGKLDFILAPSFFSYQPQLPIQIWINNGDGTFYDGTSTVIDGAIPTTGSVNNIFIADLNGDGRIDVFLVDQGLEDSNATDPGFSGARNIVLLSQANGKLRDTSATSLPGQLPRFNHVSSIGDVNGDGKLDIVLTRLGGRRVVNAGIVFLINDGNGVFTETTNGLPISIAQRNDQQAPPAGVDFQRSGANAIADLDGDGLPDLITGSYNGLDAISRTRSLRLHAQSSNGTFLEVRRYEIPASLKEIGYFSNSRFDGNDGTGLGISGIYAADLNGDGRRDLVVIWEGASASYTQVLRNDGGFSFSDVTIDWMGQYDSTYRPGNFNAGVAAVRITDLNGDGVPDLEYRYFGSVEFAGMAAGAMALLNDGSGRMTPYKWQQNGAALTANQVQTAFSGLCSCAGGTTLFADIDGDGIDDLIVIDAIGGTTFPVKPYRQTSFPVLTFKAQISPREPLPTVVPLAKRGGVDPDGDGKHKILLRNAAAQMQMLRLNGSSLQSVAVVDPGPSFRVVGVADFDGNGKSDLAFVNIAQGDRGDARVRFEFLASNERLLRQIRTVWDLQAYGDLDGDGLGDLVWRYIADDPRDTGVSYIWFTHPTNEPQVRKRGGAPLTWKLAGAMDINGDGAADMAYISPDRQVRVLMATGSRTCANLPAGIVPVGFTVLKFDDFTGRLRGDLLIRNGATGETRLLVLDASNIPLPPPGANPDDPNASCSPTTGSATQTSLYLPPAPATWQFFAAGDLDGNGVSDIVWRQPSGQLTVWLMSTSVGAPVVIANAGSLPAGFTVVQP